MFVMQDQADKLLQEKAPVSELVTRSHPQLELLPDDDLVIYMAFKGNPEEEELAKRACEQLHSRHARLLLATCVKYGQETVAESAEDFVNQTFLKAYEVAEQFVCLDGADRTNQVLAWLFKIMKNLYLDSLRSEGRRPTVYFADEVATRLEEIEEIRQESADQVPTRNKAAMRAFLDTLSPSEEAILTSTAEYWDPRSGESVMDDSVRKKLCAELGVTESSLRVKRKRLKDRAKIFIQKY
jgi:RNA polymerase sigma factor (sigma-70 family)